MKSLISCEFFLQHIRWLRVFVTRLAVALWHCETLWLVVQIIICNSQAAQDLKGRFLFFLLSKFPLVSGIHYSAILASPERIDYLGLLAAQFFSRKYAQTEIASVSALFPESYLFESSRGWNKGSLESSCCPTLNVILELSLLGAFCA